MAATAIGLSTAVLSSTGVASAAGSPSLSFSTEDGDVTSGPVPEGICAIDWRVIGGEGGVDGDGDPGLPGGEMQLTTLVETGDVFALSAGAAGTAAAGEASVVTRDGQTFLSAGGGGLAGGATATNVGFDKYIPMYGFHDSSQPGYTVGTTASGHTGGGLIEGTGRLCTAPPAPYVTGEGWAMGASTLIPFTPIPGSGHGGTYIPFQPGDGWEYSLDKTTWTSFAPSPQGEDGELTLSVPGLQVGQAYAVSIRATSLVGPGEATTVTVTPRRTYLPPVDVEATPGFDSLTVSWKAPAYVEGVTGWDVGAFRVGTDDLEQEAPAAGCTTAADARSCTFPVEAGFDYDVSVAAVSEGYYQSLPGSAVHSGVVPALVAPAAVPAASAPLTTTDADKTVGVGEQVTVSGSGYLPGSDVEIVMYSAPQVLTTVVADADGDFTATVTVPAGLASGTHHLVAAGVDEDGTPRYLVVEVVVTGGVAAVTGATAAGSSLTATGEAGATEIATTGTKAATAGGGLAYTGFSALPFVGGGLLALLAGGGLFLAARRRSA
jgi:hypothetical protein